MKIHISNIHNAALSDRVKLQHKLAEAGHALGMYELGIFSYPVDGDTPEQLSTRLDGLVSSLEHGDRVILQLPTGNGREFEEKLAWRIQTYTGHYPSLLISENLGEEYLPMLRESDSILADKRWIFEDLKQMLGREASEKLSFYYVDNESTNLEASLCLSKVLEKYTVAKKRKDEIQIAFALTDKDGTYSSRVGVAMLSTMKHTPQPVCFHILLDDTVDEVNRRRLTNIAKENGARVEFHLVDKKLFTELAQEDYLKRFSLAGLYRLLIPQLLPNLKRILYLDADIMVTCDLSDLWNTDLKGNEIGAVLDTGIMAGSSTLPIDKKWVKRDQYFNSGVILMDLKQIRQDGNLLTYFIDIYNKDYKSHVKYPMIDQDILNMIFKGKVCYLDSKWNKFTNYVREVEVKMLPGIYHFAGDNFINYSHFTDLDKNYLELREEVPWESSIINSSFLKMLHMEDYRIDQLQRLVHHLAKNKKKIIFYGYGSPSLQNLIKIIKPHGKDYFIQYDSENIGNEYIGLPVKGFASLKHEEKGKFIVITVAEAIGELEKINLEAGKDYFVANCLATKDQGGYVL